MPQKGPTLAQMFPASDMDADEFNDLHERLEEALGRGIQNKELAEVLGFSAWKISRLKNGHPPDPDQRTAQLMRLMVLVVEGRRLGRGRRVDLAARIDT